jgi:hypothetical protein
MIVGRDQLVPWMIETAGDCRFIVWSEPCKISDKKAVFKLRKLIKGRFKKAPKIIAVRPLLCFVNCWSMASELLIDEELEGVDKSWWFVGEVEEKPGEQLVVATVCPMCEKHARRFRRSLRERIIRIEERLDEAEKEIGCCVGDHSE